MKSAKLGGHPGTGNNVYECSRVRKNGVQTIGGLQLAMGKVGFKAKKIKTLEANHKLRP